MATESAAALLPSCPQLATIREALNLTTHGLCRASREQVVTLVQQLANRVTCELWGDEMGWTIPAYGTLEWQELYHAWLTNDEDAQS